MFGTGIGSAFYLLLASLSRDPRAVAVVARIVVIADWMFTATTVVAQPVTGFWLIRDHEPLPPAYWYYFRMWIALGIPAFFAFVAVFYLMVAKPATLACL